MKPTFPSRGVSGGMREYAKMALRSSLYRRNLDLVRGPFPARIGTALRWLGVQTVLDVGANIGQYGSALRASGFNGRLVSCEPLPDAFERLARRASSDQNWTALHTAVGAESGTGTINVSANSYSSSMLPMTDAHRNAAPGSGFVSTASVAMTTVRELVRTHDLAPTRTMLKIDTQGFESQVLDGAGELLDELVAVQLELSFVQLYAGQQLFDQVVARMAEHDYAIYALEAGFADPRTGRMLQCDGLFVRGDHMPDPANAVP